MSANTRPDQRTGNVSRVCLGAFFVAAGVNHFVSTGAYETMMPPLLPWPLQLVWISGAAEILGGLGVLLKRTRWMSGWGLILLLISVFPANIYAAMHGFHGGSLERALLVLRLPFQGVLIYWVYRCCLMGRKLKTPNVDARGAREMNRPAPEVARTRGWE